MQNTKLLKTLRRLDSSALKDLHVYIGLRASGSSAEIYRCWDKIYSQRPLFGSPALSKKAVYAELFPGQAYKDKRIRELISAIFQLTKAYLSEQELEYRHPLKELLCLGQFRKLGLGSVFRMQWNRIEKAVSESPYRDADYHMFRYELADEANGFYGQQQIRVLDESLQQKMHHLDAWYLSVKLKESCEMLNRQKVLNASHKNPLIEELIEYLNRGDHPFWEIPAIQVYYRIYLCLSNGESEHFYQLVNLLEKNYPLFQADETRGMFKHAQNYCIRKINGGNISFYRDLLQLYQYQLEKEIIFEQGQLAHTDFKNMVTGGLRLGEFEWVKSFMEKYHSRVDARYRDNVYNFSLASYYVETAQISLAIKLLKQITFTDVFYDISARHLLLKIYLETNEIEPAYYHIEAFRTFLKRNKAISNQNSLLHDNCLKIVLQLLRLKDKAISLSVEELNSQVNRLKKRLEQMSPIANKAWLKGEIERFSNRF